MKEVLCVDFICETQNTSREHATVHLHMLTWAAAAIAAAEAPSLGQWDCIFLHGGGVTASGPPTTSFPAYWGDLHEHTPQCRTRTFNHANTTGTDFTDPALMRSYCAAAGAPSTPNSTAIPTVRNKLVFTHSMGNLVLARALQTGVCALEANSSAWYLSGAPLRGTAAAVKLIDICGHPTVVQKPLRFVFEELGLCEGRNVSAEFYSYRPDNPALVGLAEVANRSASGAMCGTSAFGIVSKYSAALDAVAALVRFGEPNDGLVGFSSCAAGGWPAPRAGGTTTSTTASDLHRSVVDGEDDAKDDADELPDWYAAPMNHADNSGRDGDGKKALPVSWFGTRRGKVGSMRS